MNDNKSSRNRRKFLGDALRIAGAAGIAAGADGLIIEVHPHPEEAWADGAQSLKPEKFAQLVTEIKRIAEAVGRC